MLLQTVALVLAARHRCLKPGTTVDTRQLVIGSIWAHFTAARPYALRHPYALKYRHVPIC